MPRFSSKLKDAWKRARKYAAKHGISVKEARSLLANDEASAKTPSRSRRTSVGETGEKELAAAERELRQKYPHIVAGTLKVHKSGPHKGRRTVEIRCKTKGCPKRRIIHTSDAFQVELCLECTTKKRFRKRSS